MKIPEDDKNLHN